MDRFPHSHRSRLAGALTTISLALLLAPPPLVGQAPAAGVEGTPPPLDALRTVSSSELRPVVDRYVEDRGAVLRRWDVAWSPARRDRLERFYRGWADALDAMEWESLGVEERIDHRLLAGEVRYELALLEREAAQWEEMGELLPFLPRMAARVEAWRRFEEPDPREVAGALADLTGQVRELDADLRRRLASGAPGQGGVPSRSVGLRAADALADLRRSLGAWYGFYEAYDPAFGWWVRVPWEGASDALEAYLGTLRRDLVGLGGDPLDQPIIGDPIGAEGLAADLEHEMIPYTPEELLRIAEREFAWTEERMREAARDMGYGDDLEAALEHVKTLHPEPGGQPEVVRRLAREAVDFVREHDLVTVPELADEVWRWSMMSPERQEIAPFFLGGEVVQISYPTGGMAHEDKLMSLRGNNVHFSRAVVHHELIPGHHLQGFMTDRYNPHRNYFRTPFWGEGWALWWEMRLWDAGFADTPEDRMGMLFWRAHRAARILFSLGFHLGRMTPEEAVELLVERVGHERANAEAEVRRSFTGQYPPLYQAAYMLGGLQFRALHEELVGSGRMTDRAFHDAILRGGRMPVELVRYRLRGELLPRDHGASWRFADPL